jgi:hypothetical protein
MLTKTAANCGMELRPSSEKRSNSAVPLTLDDLYAFLVRYNWVASSDLARMYASHKEHDDVWLDSKVVAVPSEAQFATGGALSMFVIRGFGWKHNLMPFILQLLTEGGLVIVGVIPLVTAEQRVRATQRIRGGDWRADGYRMSAGPPEAGILV